MLTAFTCTWSLPRKASIGCAGRPIVPSLESLSLTRSSPEVRHPSTRVRWRSIRMLNPGMTGVRMGRGHAPSLSDSKWSAAHPPDSRSRQQDTMRALGPGSTVGVAAAWGARRRFAPLYAIKGDIRLLWIRSAPLRSVAPRKVQRPDGAPGGRAHRLHVTRPARSGILQRMLTAAVNSWYAPHRGSPAATRTPGAAANGATPEVCGDDGRGRAGRTPRTISYPTPQRTWHGASQSARCGMCLQEMGGTFYIAVELRRSDAPAEVE